MCVPDAIKIYKIEVAGSWPVWAKATWQWYVDQDGEEPSAWELKEMKVYDRDPDGYYFSKSNNLADEPWAWELPADNIMVREVIDEPFIQTLHNAVYHVVETDPPPEPKVKE